MALEKRAAPQSADALRTGSGILMTATALVEEAEGHVVVVEGRSAAEAAASTSHVPDALELSMHAVARVEMVGREVNVDPEQAGTHKLHGPALTKEALQSASEMNGLAVPTVLQSAPKAPATQAHTAAEEAPPPGACVQKPWPLHGSNAHEASHAVALATDVWVMAGQASPAPAGVVATVRLRVYCRGASAGAVMVAGAGLPQGLSMQLREDCAMTIALEGMA